MRALLTFTAFLTAAASGCAADARRVRDEAKITLDCSSVSVHRNDEHGRWVANGCGKVAICSLAKHRSAEPFCAGGAPALAAH